MNFYRVMKIYSPPDLVSRVRFCYPVPNVLKIPIYKRGRVWFLIDGSFSQIFYSIDLTCFDAAFRCDNVIFFRLLGRLVSSETAFYPCLCRQAGPHATSRPKIEWGLVWTCSWDALNKISAAFLVRFLKKEKLNQYDKVGLPNAEYWMFVLA